MKQSEGFSVKGKKDLVSKLKRSLYGIKKPLRMWYKNFFTYILSLLFVRRKDDHYVYSKEYGDHYIYMCVCVCVCVSLYVDNMFLVRNNMDAIKEVKKNYPPSLT
jgi:hypothetical protein